jgi:5'-nucleotidase
MNMRSMNIKPTNTKPMNILLCNDDGIDSPGIRRLIEYLQPYGRLWLATPVSQRSATSHGITTRETISVEEIAIEGTHKAWRIGGLPADCVKLALLELMQEPADLVISGINEGSNLGTDTLYSGTVAAAVEGAFMGVPALAISLAQEEGTREFGPAAAICAQLVQRLQEGSLEIAPMSILNINVPPCPISEIKGYKAARLGVRRYKNYFHLEARTQEITHYWLRGEIIPGDCGDFAANGGPGIIADIDAVAQGYVSVVPISVDRTDYNLLANLIQDLGRE